MITTKEFMKIKNELMKYFPEAETIENHKEALENELENDTQKISSHYETFYLYMNKGKRVALKFSKEYLEQRNFEEFCKHLQRNIYYVMKSNMDKSIYLLKNFEIEVGETSYA